MNYERAYADLAASLDREDEPLVLTDQDFVVTGLAESDPELPSRNIDAKSIRSSLLYEAHNPRRNVVSPVGLCSNHSRKTDYIAVSHGRLLSSARLAVSDLTWLLAAAGLHRRDVSSAIREHVRATREAASPAELPWEPMARYVANQTNTRAMGTRGPRGQKGAAHLEVLRTSDPLVKATGWVTGRDALRECRSSIAIGLLARASSRSLVEVDVEQASGYSAAELDSPTSISSTLTPADMGHVLHMKLPPAKKHAAPQQLFARAPAAAR